MRFTTPAFALLLLAACAGPEQVEETWVAAAPRRANSFLDKVTVASVALTRVEVEAQFQALAQSGFDGVGLQRLVAQTADPFSRSRADDVTASVRATAEQNAKVFYVEYELAGAGAGDWAELIRRDWSELERVTDSPAYAHQDGRPVVVLRGVGVMNRPGTVAETMDVIDWLKAQGCYVVGGVPAGWRTGEATRPNFLSAFLRLDAIQPWSDGAAVTVSAGAASADRAYAAQLGIAYQQLAPIPAVVAE